MEEIKNNAYKSSFNSVDELESSLGKEIGLTNWYEMDQDRINIFADATEDHQWIHLDKEKCEKEFFDEQRQTRRDGKRLSRDGKERGVGVD